MQKFFIALIMLSVLGTGSMTSVVRAHAQTETVATDIQKACGLTSSKLASISKEES